MKLRGMKEARGSADLPSLNGFQRHADNTTIDGDITLRHVSEI